MASNLLFSAAHSKNSFDEGLALGYNRLSFLPFQDEHGWPGADTDVGLEAVSNNTNAMAAANVTEFGAALAVFRRQLRLVTMGRGRTTTVVAPANAWTAASGAAVAGALLPWSRA